MKKLEKLDMQAVLDRISERQAALGGLSDRATCITAGLKPSYIGDLRRTERRIEPSVGKLLALAKALNCSLEYLATGENPPRTDISQEDLGVIRQLHSLSTAQRAMVRRLLIPVDESEIEEPGKNRNG